MKKIQLINFKAFKNETILDLGVKDNALIYGENGSGKTSLFEAFKLFYFRERILRERIMPNVVDEEALEAERNRIIDDYKHDSSLAMTIEIDDENFLSHNNTDDNVFLVNYEQLAKGEELDIKEMISNSYFSHKNSFDDLQCADFYKLLVEEINKDLSQYFFLDDVEVYLFEDAEGKCSIKNKNVLSLQNNYLTRYFNESVLHIVRFSIIAEIINYLTSDEDNTLVVFDDCFNSLDTPNRTFLMKFLLEKTKNVTQKIVLTHNTGFYNLFGYIFNNVYGEEGNLQKYRLININGQQKFLDGNEKTTACIKEERASISDPISLGNDIRQRFETIVYELSRLNNIGELQETRTLLDKMCKKDCSSYLYVDHDGNCKNVYDLVNEIYANVTNGNDYQLAKRLKEKIDNYKNKPFIRKIQPWLVELRLMQKVSLHQASHGHANLAPTTVTEIDYSIALLDKLEAALKSVSSREDISSI